MPYIGKEPVAGNFVLLDSITTSATATYALTKDSVAYSPESARNMIVSLNGVTQAPEAAFTVSGSNITFSSALTASDVIDYILVLGDVLSVGTPSDGTVGTSQMSYPLDNFSSTGIDDNATSTAITIDSSQNVGIGTASPSQLLNVAGNADVNGDFYVGSSNNIIYESGTTFNVRAAVANLTFQTNGANERMRIDSSGNVGIGITSMVNPLHVGLTSNTASKTSGSAFDGGALRLDGALSTTDSEVGILGGSNDGLSSGIGFARESSGDWGTQIRFYTHGTAITTTDELTERMRLDASGNLGIGTATPVESSGYNSLTINDTTSGYLALQSAGSTKMEAYVSGGTEATLRGTGVPLALTTTAAHDITFDTNAAERMRIDSSGRVGIGQSAPDAQLTLNPPNYTSSATDGMIKWKNSNNSGHSNVQSYFVSGQGTDLNIGANAYVNTFGAWSRWSSGLATSAISCSRSGNINFITNTSSGDGITRAVIDSSGNVGIGRTPSYRFDVEQTADATTARLFSNQSGFLSSNQAVLFIDVNNGTPSSTSSFSIIADYNGTEQFKVRNDGTIYAQNTTVQSISDIRVKENVQDSTEGLSVVNAVRPVRFDFKEGFGNNRKNQLGFIAQELEAVFPDAVDVTGEEDENGDSYKSVGPAALIPVLVKAIQEQQAMIETLQAQVAELQGA